MRSLYHNSCKKKSGKPESLPLFELSEQRLKTNSTNTVIISHIQHFFNAFQPIAYCRPAVMCLCCNFRKRKPLNVPQ